jgi:hypothetical protein
MRRRNFVVMLLVLFALMLALPLGVLAQDAPPDVTPVVGELTGGIETFLTSAGLVMGLVSFVVIQALKWALPGRVVETRTIYVVVVGLFAIGYVVAGWAGFTERLQEGVGLLDALAGPVWQIILLLASGPLAYELFRKANNPVFGAGQGAQAFRLQHREEPSATGTLF